MQYVEYDPIEMLRVRLSPLCTQSDLARQIGISPQYLSEILKGRRPPSKIVIDFLDLEKIIIYRLRTKEEKPRRRRS
jgi:transcriptional regulator with XRE-family HTH domain